MLIILALVVVSVWSAGQGIRIMDGDRIYQVATGTERNQSFYQSSEEMDCGMPQLFILADRTHKGYIIQSHDIAISSIQGLWYPIESYLSCSDGDCLITVDNLCGQGNQVNRIKMETEIGDVQYLTNCSPDVIYKPFEMGLLLLIILCSITVTLSAKYSRAWSYDDYGYEIKKRDIAGFNVIVFLGMVVGYAQPGVVSLVARVAGSLIGAAGVAVCLSELLWLFNKSNMRIKILKKIRLIDLISMGSGLLFIPLYWLLKGQWLVNDIMAICSVVALMKLLKIRSLCIAVLLTLSLLILQATVGIFIHYVFKTSYNNYVINIFQNPNILVMPSITRQLYRQCAWLPITSILFPGLLLSYLRRFDVSRSTNIYLLIGLVSFYLGSFTWMLIDMEIGHSLPFAIVTEPITIAVICLQSFRRNQFKILWKGVFYDEEFVTSEHLSFSEGKEHQIGNDIGTKYADLTSNLRLTKTEEESSDNYHAFDY